MQFFVFFFTDSVEDGEKLIQTALDAFGQIGEFLFHFMLCVFNDMMF